MTEHCSFGCPPARPDVAPRPRPSFLFLEINTRCNLRCRSCVYWRRPEKTDGEISQERRKELVREFAGFSARGAALVLCGGEATLEGDAFFDLCRTARASGLRVLDVTNGTTVRTPADAEHMIEHGPTEITVSLNSADPTCHDQSRGSKGAFEKTVRALRLLVEARAARGAATKLFVMALVTESNYRRLPELYELARDLRVDRLKLNFVQPTFGLDGGPDEHFAEEIPRDPEALARTIVACGARFGVRYNPRWLDAVRDYHESVLRNGNARQGWWALRGTRGQHCNSAERNIMVDLRGRAAFCFSARWPAVPLERDGDMAALWDGAAYARRRQQMAWCRAYCGISHSVRRENATLK